MNARLLTTKEFNELHNGLNTAIKLRDIMSEWYLNKKTTAAVVSNNACNTAVVLQNMNHPKYTCTLHTIHALMLEGPHVNE